MKKIMEVSTMKAENNVMYIIKGIGVAIVFTLIALLVFAAVLTYTNLTESSIAPVIIMVSSVSILIGSSMSTIKIKKNGLLHGSIVGGVYIALLYLVSSMVNTGFEVNSYTIIMMVSSVLAGIIGGIVGVNIK